MLEKEIKILDVDLAKLKKKLAKLGAEMTFEGDIHDIYYDYADSSLQQDRKRIRIRKIGDTHMLTMKKRLPHKTLKICEEDEIIIDDAQSMHESLLAQGLTPHREKKKRRIAYTHNDIHFDIDCYPGIPPILEIEAESAKKIKKWIKKLGVQKNPRATRGAWGLFRYYGQEELLLQTSI